MIYTWSQVGNSEVYIAEILSFLSNCDVKGVIMMIHNYIIYNAEFSTISIVMFISKMIDDLGTKVC